MLLSSLLFAAATFSSTAVASIPFPPNDLPLPHIPYVDDPDESQSLIHQSSSQTLASHNTIYYFDQLIDHNDPSKGTFKQRYWHSYEFYETGGPIVLLTPGEVSAEKFTGYLGTGTISGAIAQALNGSGVILEHRFFGESNPYGNLSVESLQVHTLHQAIEDLEYFAKNVKLPMPDGDKVAPGKTPWILVGGSYAGALTSYALHSKPDVFYAGYASSAVVQAIADFWGYFEAIRQNMPANCTADVNAVIEHVDSILAGGDNSTIQAMKANFGLQDIVHVDDFAAAMKYIFIFYQNDIKYFSKFCEAMEVDENNKTAPAAGWGLDHAYKAWGKFWNETFYPHVCGSSDAEACLGGSHNASSTRWNHIQVPNAGRSWKWLQCREFGFFPSGAPRNARTLVSRFLTIEREERGCAFDFPGGLHGSLRKSTLNALGVNAAYGGWQNAAPRLFFANGLRDPWREATVASDFSIQLTLSEDQPHALADGAHCTDMLISNTTSERVHALQQSALGYMKKWHAEWTPTASHSG